MTTSQKIIGGIAVVALILSALANIRMPSKSTPNSPVEGNVAGNTLSPTGVYLPNPTVLDFLENRVALLADSQFMLGGATLATSIDEVPSIGNCAAATSTAFIIANPFNATSTAIVILNGSANATSTLFEVGTTTRAVGYGGLLSTDVSPTLINATLGTSSVAWFLRSGVTVGSGASAGAGTSETIAVGPGERVAGFTSSTYSGSGLTNYTYDSCTYKVKWEI